MQLSAEMSLCNILRKHCPNSKCLIRRIAPQISRKHLAKLEIGWDCGQSGLGGLHGLGGLRGLGGLGGLWTGWTAWIGWTAWTGWIGWIGWTKNASAESDQTRGDFKRFSGR